MFSQNLLHLYKNKLYKKQWNLSLRSWPTQTQMRLISLIQGQQCKILGLIRMKKMKMHL